MADVPFFILEKKRYRESYISDDLDLDPPGSESSPGLSRHSTSSSGIEADARQHSISTEMASMEEEGQRQAEKRFSSAASHGSSCTSGFDTGIKARMEDEGWPEEGEKIFILNQLYVWTVYPSHCIFFETGALFFECNNWVVDMKAAVCQANLVFTTALFHSVFSQAINCAKRGAH